jgi:hypothetical protein
MPGTRMEFSRNLSFWQREKTAPHAELGPRPLTRRSLSAMVARSFAQASVVVVAGAVTERVTMVVAWSFHTSLAKSSAPLDDFVRASAIAARIKEDADPEEAARKAADVRDGIGAGIGIHFADFTFQRRQR